MHVGRERLLIIDLHDEIGSLMVLSLLLAAGGCFVESVGFIGLRGCFGERALPRPALFRLYLGARWLSR